MKIGWLRTIVFAALIAGATRSTVTAAEPEASGIWINEREATRHVQSGFACPSVFENMTLPERRILALNLKTVIIGSSGRPPGDEVGCEYEANGGSWASVEIVRLGADETVETRRRLTRERISQRFPDALGKPHSPVRMKSPTGGKTYAAAYYNVRVGDRRGVLAAAGGEVAGWMITVIQFDYSDHTEVVKLWTAMMWQQIAGPARDRSQ